MIRRLLVSKLSKFSFIALCAVAVGLFVLPSVSNAQGLELGGGWAHVSGDFGMDGFNAGAAWYFAPRLSIAANYDDAWNTSQVGNFAFTSLGTAIASKSHVQDFLIGPRFFFAPYRIDRRNRVIPFGDARFGISHLHQLVQEGPYPAAVGSDSAFSWMLGGGVDYPLAAHWVARGELGLLRTHLNATAQSRLRLAISIAYTFGARGGR
jgi:hypothetical protein